MNAKVVYQNFFEKKLDMWYSDNAMHQSCIIVYVMYLARWLNNFTALEEKFMIFVRSPYEMRLRCAIVF